MTDLKPCPFCGDIPSAVLMGEPGNVEQKAECINMGCALYQHLFPRYLWNSRPDLQALQPKVEIPTRAELSIAFIGDGLKLFPDDIEQVNRGLDQVYALITERLGK